MIVAIAVGIHVATASLGLAASVRHRRFGRWHHVMFFLCCLSWIGAVVDDPSARTIVPGVVLAVMPFVPARRLLHRLLGTAVVLSWLPALVAHLSR